MAQSIPYLFSLAYRKQLERVKEALIDWDVEVEEHTLLAYLDDTTVLVKSEQVANAEAAIDDAFNYLAEDMGFTRQADKCSKHTSTQVLQSGLKLLGTFIGPTAARKAFLNGKIDKLQLLTDKLEQLRKQDANLILRKCLLPRLQHLQRTLDPGDIYESWLRHDDIIREAVYDLCGNVDESEQQKELLQLPVREGGLGFTAATMTHQKARQASLSLTQRVITGQWGENVAKRVLGEAEIGIRPLRQRDLMKGTWRGFALDVLESMDVQTKALVKANAGRLATGWLRAAPVEKGLILSDATVAAVLRQRLILPPNRTTGACNRCGMIMPPAGHELNCATSQPLRTRRHDKLKRILARMFAACATPHLWMRDRTSFKKQKSARRPRGQWRCGSIPTNHVPRHLRRKLGQRQEQGCNSVSARTRSKKHSACGTRRKQISTKKLFSLES